MIAARLSKTGSFLKGELKFIGDAPLAVSEEIAEELKRLGGFRIWSDPVPAEPEAAPTEPENAPEAPAQPEQPAKPARKKSAAK